MARMTAKVDTALLNEAMTFYGGIFPAEAVIGALREVLPPRRRTSTSAKISAQPCC